MQIKSVVVPIWQHFSNVLRTDSDILIPRNRRKRSPPGESTAIFKMISQVNLELSERRLLVFHIILHCEKGTKKSSVLACNILITGLSNYMKPHNKLDHNICKIS